MYAMPRLYMIPSSRIPGYSARAARNPAPTIPKAMSGRAAASGVDVGDMVARADVTRFDASATSLGSGLFLTSVQIRLARSVAAGGTEGLACVQNSSCCPGQGRERLWVGKMDDAWKKLTANVFLGT